MKIIFAIFITFLSLIELPAYATQTVIDGGLPNQQSAAFADISSNIKIAATRFALPQNVTFDQLEWWGGYFNTGSPQVSDSFKMYIYSDIGGTPTSPIFTVNLGNGTPTPNSFYSLNNISTTEYAYKSILTSISLDAGNYFIGLERNSSGDRNSWAWGSTSGGLQSGGAYYISLPGLFSRWENSSSHNLAFRASLISPVPEPESFFLFGLGFAFVFALQRPIRFSVLNK